ncbi:MAG: pilus assembly PilX N-terminal domain-containing protein [Elusimicrobiota bacterium]
MKDRGSALISTLMIVTALSVLSVTAYRLTRTQVRESVYFKRLAQAHAVAEAGLEDALLQLRRNVNWRTGFSNKPFAGGSYTVTLSADKPPWVLSTGRSAPVAAFGPAVKTVRVLARLEYFWTEAGSTAIFANQTLKNDGLIDAYNSATDPDPASFGFGANLWSNGNIILRKGEGIRIRGNVSFYSGEVPRPQEVEGGVLKTTFTVTLPFYSGAAYIAANDNATGISPASAYNAGSKTLTVPSGTTVTMAPGNYYLNGIQVQGTLRVDNGAGPASIYLAGPMAVAAGGSVVNVSKLPARLAVYGQAALDITLYSGAPLRAAITARDAAVTLGQTYYGTMVCRTVDMKSAAVFHADTPQTGALEAKVHWEPGSWSASHRRQ